MKKILPLRGSMLLLLCGVAWGLVARGDEPQLKSGVDKANFDTSVKPGDDFFEYVNGTWIKKNPIPPEYSRWGAFPKLRDDNLLALKQIVEGLPAFGDLPSLPSEAAQVILTAAGNVLDEAAHSDRDDTLGEHLLAIPATGTSDEEMTWVFKQEGIGLSTWDYTVRYRIMRAEATHAL